MPLSILPNLHAVSITFNTRTARPSDTILHVFIKNRTSDTFWADGATDFITNSLAYSHLLTQGVYCRNPYLATFSALANGEGFPDGSVSQEYFLLLRSTTIPCGEIILPVVNIHILPNGSATWAFNYTVKFYFADPNNLSDPNHTYDFLFSSSDLGLPGIILSETNRDYVGVGIENPNALANSFSKSGFDSLLTQVEFTFNTVSGTKLAGTQLNVQVVNRTGPKTSTVMGSIADLFSDMELNDSMAAVSNGLSASSGLASSTLGLQDIVLPVVNISIDPDSQQGTWIFDFRVQYYFSTGAYPRALMFESTTSGINLDQSYNTFPAIYLGDSFPTLPPVAAPLTQQQAIDYTSSPKLISFDLLESKLAEFINDRQTLDPSSPNPAIARIRLDNTGIFQPQVAPSNYYDFQIIDANPLSPNDVAGPNYTEPVKWDSSPTDIGVGEESTYFSGFNSQSLMLCFNPSSTLTPFTLTIVFDTTGAPGTITTSIPSIGGTYTPSVFCLSVQLTLTVAPHPIFPDTKRIDFLSWVADINNLVFTPIPMDSGNYVQVSGTYFGQPVNYPAVDQPTAIGALLDAGPMLVNLTIPGTTSPGGLIRQAIRNNLWSTLSKPNRITGLNFADRLNSQLNSWVLGGTSDPQEHGALPAANACNVTSVKVNTTTQNIEIAYTGPQYGMEFSSPAGSLQKGPLSNIDHIIFVMMENRSFDHMLGYLSLPVEQGGMGRTDVDGLKGNEVNFLLDGTVCTSFQAAAGDTVLSPDPPHSYEPVSRAINHGKMDGFAQSYADQNGMGSGPNIMKYHPATNVSVFDALVRDFALCHRWFATHPGPTFPNRFYTLTGRPNIDQYGLFELNDSSPKQPVFTETIFDFLSQNNISWRYFEQSYAFLHLFEKYTFDNTNIAKFDDPEFGFANLAATGNLPSVTFIDPHFIELPPQGNSDGAPADIRQGQLFVEQIVQAVVTSPSWEKTLLVITYDEHGGFYDHVPPPPAVPVVEGLPTTYGVRVPAFVISPWVAAGSVFGNDQNGATPAAYYDHTSILKTITKCFLSSDVKLGPIYAAANDLSSLIQPQLRSSVFLPFIPYNLLFNISQMSLEVEGGVATAGTALWQAQPNNASNAQQFSFEDAGSGYFYIRTHTGNMYLTADLPGSGTPPVIGVTQEVKFAAGGDQNPDSQLWGFIWLPTQANSGVQIVTIHNKAVPGMTLHPAAQSTATGAAVVLETVAGVSMGDTTYLWIISSPLIPNNSGIAGPIGKPAPVEVTPSSLDFPPQQIGLRSGQQAVTVVQQPVPGNSPLAITAIALLDSTGAASADFSSVPPPGSPPPGGSVNIQNGQLVITVWFTPIAAGTRSATLQVSHNQPGSPLTVQLSGTGNPAPLPLLSFSPASLNFNPTKITNHTVTLTNSGTAPLIIFSIEMPVSNYTMTNTCNIGAAGGTLQPGQQCTINVVCLFKTAGGQSQMIITHNAAGSPVAIELNATAKGGGGGQ